MTVDPTKILKLGGLGFPAELIVVGFRGGTIRVRVDVGRPVEDELKPKVGDAVTVCTEITVETEITVNTSTLKNYSGIKIKYFGIIIERNFLWGSPDTRAWFRSVCFGNSCGSIDWRSSRSRG